MDVEKAGRAGAGVAEAVSHSRWGGNEGAGSGADDLVADRELDLALEDEERVGVVIVYVRVNRAEPGLAVELEHLVLLALVLDVDLATPARQELALAGA